MTLALTILLINLALMALYCILIHPLLSITYHKTSKTEELEKHHKKLTNTLLILCGVLVALLFITIYTQSTYLLIGVTYVIMHMVFITLYNIGVYRKHRALKDTPTQPTKEDADESQL